MKGGALIMAEKYMLSVHVSAGRRRRQRYKVNLHSRCSTTQAWIY